MTWLQRVGSRVSELEADLEGLEPLIDRPGTGEDIFATARRNGVIDDRLTPLGRDRWRGQYDTATA